MSLPLTDANGVVQTIANGTPVVWNAGLGYDANGLLCVTSTLSATDVWINGWRRDALGRLVVSQSFPEGQPFVYNAGWPTDKVTGAIITQQNIPAPTDPRIAGVAVGPLGGVYMTEGGYIWTPLELWPDGIDSPGMWSSPSTLPASFNDSTGTTPVATPGTVADSANPVGLALDIRAGAPEVLGPELVTNGDFATNVSNWNTNSCTLTWVAGDASATSSGGGFWQEFATVAGVAYKAVVPIISGTTQLIVFQGGGLSVTLASEDGAAGARTATLTFFAATSASRIYIKCNTNAVVDSVSVREIPGNHMLQSTSAARPLLSARVNLLTYSEDFSNAVWIVQGATKTPGVTAPDGTSTAMTLSITSNTGNNLAQIFPGSLSLPRTASAMVKGAAGQKVFIGADDAAPQTLVTFTGEWQEVENTQTASGNVYFVFEIYNRSGGGHLPNVTFDIWHPQLNLGPTALPYQRVGAASDYTATGFPIYQKYDGTDDSMATASFAAGTLINGMDCLIAVRRDSAADMICGLYKTDYSAFFGAAESGSSAGANANSGSASVFVDGTQLTGGTAVTRGTLHTALTPGAWHILELRGLDLSAWTAAGAGGFGSYLLNGARGDIMLYPSTASTEDKDAARQYLADKYGVTLPAWVGRYNYVTPPTSSIPVAGEIVHGDNLLNKLNFSKTDLDGQTYTGPPLTTGHEVKIGDQVYTLVAPPVDFSSYITLTIEPATQLADGTYPVLVY